MAKCFSVTCKYKRCNRIGNPTSQDVFFTLVRWSTGKGRSWEVGFPILLHRFIFESNSKIALIFLSKQTTSWTSEQYQKSPQNRLIFYACVCTYHLTVGDQPPWQLPLLVDSFTLLLARQIAHGLCLESEWKSIQTSSKRKKKPSHNSLQRGYSYLSPYLFIGWPITPALRTANHW